MMKRKIRNPILIIMLAVPGILTFGQNKIENPFGLVYKDAIAENVRVR